MAKTREYECPDCGEFEEVTTSAVDTDIEVAEENAELYEYIAVRRKCHRCGAQWTEYMRLVYDGYCNRDGTYDKNGIKVTD